MLKCFQGQSDRQLFPLLCNGFLCPVAKSFLYRYFIEDCSKTIKMEIITSLSFALCVPAIFDLVSCNRTLLGLYICVKQQRCCSVWSHPKKNICGCVPMGQGLHCQLSSLGPRREDNSLGAMAVWAFGWFGQELPDPRRVVPISLCCRISSRRRGPAGDVILWTFFSVA